MTLSRRHAVRPGPGLGAARKRHTTTVTVTGPRVRVRAGSARWANRRAAEHNSDSESESGPHERHNRHGGSDSDLPAASESASLGWVSRAQAFTFLR
jgi:hypothetical protein